MRLIPTRLRAAVLMAVGALVVHELRYLFAYGEHADGQLAAQGHGYLGVVTLLVGLLAAAAIGLFLRQLFLAWRGDASAEGSRQRLVGVWLGASLGLVAIYAGQELLEGLLASGHPGGLHGVFGHGGWMAVPTAVAIGGLIALALRGGRAALVWAAARRRPEPRRRPRGAGRRPVATVVLPRLAPLASSAAGRAPPALLNARI